MASSKLDPVLVDGRWWVFPGTGQRIALIAGGDGSGDGGDAGGAGDGNGDGDRGDPGNPGNPGNQADPDENGGAPGAKDREYPEGLGDAGKRALDAERDARAEAERKWKAAEKAAADAARERDALKQKTESEQEKAVREAADTAREEERTKAKERILASEIKARAAGKLADPEDAVLHLTRGDTTAFISDELDVDDDKIVKAIDKLLEKKPHLKAQGATRKPSADGGARAGSDKDDIDVEGRLKRMKERQGVGA